MNHRRCLVAGAMGLLAQIAAGCGTSTPSISVDTVAAPSSVTLAPPASTTNSPTSTSASSSTATNSTNSVTTAVTTLAPRPVVPPVRWPELVALGDSLGSFDEPVDVEQHPQSGVWYVVEQPGVVRRVAADRRSALPDAADLTSLVRSGGEQGLLGLSFDPEGERVFLNYTDDDGDTVVSTMAVLEDGTFEPSSARVLLQLEQPYRNHNGGEVLWGPDGALWVPTGDGGSANDPQRVALDPNSRLGKLLRIDPDTADVEVWASGLRNPWRASFDAATGDLWLADVGQGDLEEVSVAVAAQRWARGRNFGWSAFEGTRRHNDDQPVEGHVAPVFQYEHGEQGCSITGGVRYRGTALAALWGAYVFSDYCSGRIRALPVRDDGSVGTPVDLATMTRVVAVRADRAGELWVVSLDGDIRPLISTG